MSCGHTASSISIAFIGGMTAQGMHYKNTMTPAQEAALILLCRQLAERYPEIRYEHECLLNIHAHNEYSVKRCPCFDVQDWRKEWGL